MNGAGYVTTDAKGLPVLVDEHGRVIGDVDTVEIETTDAGEIIASGSLREEVIGHIDGPRPTGVTLE